MTNDEITSRLAEIDAQLQKTTDAKRLLGIAHERFPLNEMPDELKGTHSLTLSPEGRLVLSIWAKDESDAVGSIKTWQAMEDE